MEKALLYAILALSLNVFAQPAKPVPAVQNFSSNSTDNIRSRIQMSIRSTPEVVAQISNTTDVKNQAPLQNSSASALQLPDSIYTWNWDQFSGWYLYHKYINMIYDANNNLSGKILQAWNSEAWVNIFKNNATYDAKNNKSSETTQSWIDNTWVNFSQVESTYDENSNKTKEISRLWSENAWQDQNQVLYSYDANNNLVQKREDQGWNGTAWLDSKRNIYTYDAYNNQTGMSAQHLDGSSWSDIYRDTVIYDVNNNPVSVLNQYWSGTDWLNSQLYLYYYDVNNNNTSQLNQNWDGAAWINASRVDNVYDADNNPTSGLSQQWVNGAWENLGQSLTTYDLNNNPTSYTSQNWYGGAWINSFQFVQVYDAEGFVKSDTYKLWNNDGSYVYQGDSNYYYYHTVATGIAGSISTGIYVYPNPATAKINIDSKSDINSIEIYNLSGNRVYADLKLKKQTSKEVDLSNFTKGMYLLKIYCGTKVSSCKVVVQ